jgi:limonene-1,2-epoxide hydrolase
MPRHPEEVLMATSVDEWVEAYRSAWEERDAEAAAVLFTEDATYRSNIVEDAYEGRAGVAEYWRTVTQSQSDVEVRMGRPFVDGTRVAVEFWTTMAVDGAPTTLPGCLLLDFDAEGLCRRLREYWHFLPGSHEPPPEWGQ